MEIKLNQWRNYLMTKESKRIPLYGIGDKVKIINYGHFMWTSKEEWKAYYKAKIVFNKKPKHLIEEQKDLFLWDLRPELIGEKGIVNKVSTTQNVPKYSIKGIGAWY